MLGLGSIAKKVFGSSNDRAVRKYRPRVDEINALEKSLEEMSDIELRGRTEEFREKIKAGAALDSLLVPAFATVREAAKRALGQRHYDVQLIGGMVLHEGKISEMKTGEGKTLVATLPVYLNALSGKGVHVVTVNDYLAKRDAEWMGKVYGFLGLSTGVIVHGLDDAERRAAYACDVTYGTNNEFGFDYLRDNMKYELAAMTQRGHNFAIVDEVDSILVDEARTPLIISGPVEDKSGLYQRIDKIIPTLIEEDFELDEKAKAASFTEIGNEKIEKELLEDGTLKGTSLYDVENVMVVHHLNNALRAHKIFQKDRDYIVKHGGVVIIDEFTGRAMEGRRFSDGLHQALEAKENVQIQPENQTLASVTFQNYFRMYGKLAGMTGTAMTEAEEFMDIYKLDVVEIPTNTPIARIDDDDEVYRTAAEKYRAIIKVIEDCRERGQPVLVGTTSIEKSEFIAERLREAGIKEFQVLNARYHEQEAYIVAQAGVPGAITIATNMAGRGTDIQLGGNPDMRISQDLDDMPEGAERTRKEEAIRKEVAELKQKALNAGGLYIIATERHESRRIDNQLRGRSGRQGDPGHSHFFLSLEDDLMRIFGSDRMDKVLKTLGLQEDEAIAHPWVNKALANAQQKVEARNFDIRKNLLKFDDVMNDQRKVIFEQRIELMSNEGVVETIGEMREDVVADLVTEHIPEKAYPEQWKSQELQDAAKVYLGIDAPVVAWAQEEGIAEEEITTRLQKAADKAFAAKTVRFTPDVMRQIEKAVLLQTLDHLWREHLGTLDHLRSVIGFRGYGQRDPLNEYKTEAFELFQALLVNLRKAVTQQLSHVELVQQPPQLPESALPEGATENADEGVGGQPASAAVASPATSKPSGERDPNDPSTWGKVGRNEMCPCGSGKKYKHCHGAYS